MNRFLKLKGQKILMPFMMMGDPNFEDSLALAEIMLECGAGALEIGLPFSDPLADGLIIQASSERAIKAGMNFDKALKGIARLRSKTDIPIVVLTYTNLLFHRGFEAGLKELAHAGVDALLLADLSLDEALKLKPLYEQNNIGQVFLIAQNTDLERAKMIHRHSTGFSYLVNAMGVTGMREGVPEETLNRLAILKQEGKAPLIVGFGIHKKDQVETLWHHGADGVIIASKLIDIIAKAKNIEDAKLAVRHYLKEII